MAESILTSTKAALGVAEDTTAFDTELILYINSVLSRLTQLMIGPPNGFRINGKEETWEEFLSGTVLEGTETINLLNNAKGYMALRVKLLFDPPDIGFVLTAMKEQIEKEEFLLNVTVDDTVPVKEVIPVESEPNFG